MADNNICCGGLKLIFACSGAADTGDVSDKAARELTRMGKGKMYCLAGIGGKVEGIINTTKKADEILAIDGCSVNCVKHSLDEAGIDNYKHLRLTDLGMTKGQSPATKENIDKVIKAAEELM